MAQARVDELAARFAADPADRVAFEALEEAHFVAGRWSALVDLYTHRLAARDLDARKHAARRARLLLRLAQVLEERCDRVDDAVKRYQEALRLDPALRPALKAQGLLTRDPRMRERKKYGQPGARKRFQFSKR